MKQRKHSDLGIIADAIMAKAPRRRTSITVTLTFLPDQVGIRALREVEDPAVRMYVIRKLLKLLNYHPDMSLGKVRIDSVTVVRGKR